MNRNKQSLCLPVLQTAMPSECKSTDDLTFDLIGELCLSFFNKLASSLPARSRGASSSTYLQLVALLR